MRLGAHLSIAGGLSKAVKAAKEIGANTLQIFSGSPRSWQTKKLRSLEIEKFRNLAGEYGLSPIFIHSKYLVNLASKNKKIRHLSTSSLVADLNLAAKIGALGVIFHPKTSPPKRRTVRGRPSNSFNILIRNIKEVLSRSPSATFLILENSAQMKLEKIGKVIKAVADSRVKFCLDTAHAYQAGYNLTTNQGLEKVYQEIEGKIGWQNWIAIHANDSKTALGSKNDRHEDIGKGKLGPAPFFVFLNHPASSKLPFILETPGFKDEGLKADRRNLKKLKKLVGKKLGQDFFRQPTLKVAKALLGKYLVVNRGSQFQVGQIIETEAYIGQKDKASHASKGKTKRTKVMWGEPARLYVYFIYGMYHCLNIVTEKRGYPAAVLIRAIKPVFGISGKTDGPGKLCQKLKITKKDTGLDITKSKEIFIKDIGEKPKKIVAAPRIGVDYAGGWAKKKWRFLATAINQTI